MLYRFGHRLIRKGVHRPLRWRGAALRAGYWHSGMSQASGFWWWEDFAAVPASRQKLITAIAVLTGFLISIFLVGGLSHSKIGLVDENDLPQYVGSSGHVAFSQIPRLLIEKTEIGQFGESQRFRPVPAGGGFWLARQSIVICREFNDLMLFTR
jgi:hypothetical protein